jgi:hypothetical protein
MTDAAADLRPLRRSRDVEEKIAGLEKKAATARTCSPGADPGDASAIENLRFAAGFESRMGVSELPDRSHFFRLGQIAARVRVAVSDLCLSPPRHVPEWACCGGEGVRRRRLEERRELPRVRLCGGEIAGHGASADVDRQYVELAARPLLVSRREQYVELDVFADNDSLERIGRGGAPEHLLAGAVVDDGSRAGSCSGEARDPPDNRPAPGSPGTKCPDRRRAPVRLGLGWVDTARFLPKRRPRQGLARSIASNGARCSG